MANHRARRQALNWIPSPHVHDLYSGQLFQRRQCGQRPLRVARCPGPAPFSNGPREVPRRPRSIHCPTRKARSCDRARGATVERSAARCGVQVRRVWEVRTPPPALQPRAVFFPGTGTLSALLTAPVGCGVARASRKYVALANGLALRGACSLQCTVGAPG